MRRTMFAFATILVLFASRDYAQGPQGYVEKGSATKTKELAGPVKSQTSTLPIVVFVHRDDMKLVFEIEDKVYTRDELNFELGEMALDGKDRLVVVLIQDNVMLTDLKEVPTMALKAGFRKVSVFLIWQKTGSMAEMFLLRHDDNYAEVLFGPVHHATNKPKKLRKLLAPTNQP
jgi:hypothetical protein